MKLIQVGAPLAALLVIAGCTGNQPQVQTTGDPPAQSQATEGYEGELPTEDVTPTPTPAPPSVAAIGATAWFTYTDGLKVQVTKATTFTVGEFAYGAKPGSKGVMVTITIRNGSPRTIDLSGVSVLASSGPNGNTAAEISDSDHLGNGFTGSLTPGRAKTAKYGFGVPPANYSQLTIEVVPGYDLDYNAYVGAHFEGAVK